MGFGCAIIDTNILPGGPPWFSFFGRRGVNAINFGRELRPGTHEEKSAKRRGSVCVRIRRPISRGTGEKREAGEATIRKLSMASAREKARRRPRYPPPEASWAELKRYRYGKARPWALLRRSFCP